MKRTNSKKNKNTKVNKKIRRKHNLIRRSISIMLLILIFLSMFSGCYNYKDINKTTFVTSCIFDREDESIVLYVDCVKPFRSSGDSSDKGKRIIYKGKGNSVLEAARNIDAGISHKLNFTQCRAYIFTEEAAKRGINKFIDMLRKDQEFLVKPYLFVYYGDVQNLFSTVSTDEEYLGLLLNDVANKKVQNPRLVMLNMNDMLVKQSEGEEYFILGAIDLKKDVLNNRVDLDGGAILKNDKLISRLDGRQTIGYNFLTNNIKEGSIEVSNPQSPNQFITLEILKSETKTDLGYEDGRIKLHKDINLKCSLADAQHRFIVDKNTINMLEAKEKLEMETYLNSAFTKSKKDGIDIFSIRDEFKKRYPKQTYEGDIIKFTDLELNVQISIEGASSSKNSY